MMPEKPLEDSEEQVGFTGGWKGLYIFILVYGVLQIVLLYIFTRALD